MKQSENARIRNAAVPRLAGAIIVVITVRIQACQLKAIMTNRWIQARDWFATAHIPSVARRMPARNSRIERALRKNAPLSEFERVSAQFPVLRFVSRSVGLNPIKGRQKEVMSEIEAFLK